MKIVLDKFFKDKYGNIVLGQKPNAPIIIAFILWALSKFLFSPIDTVAYILFLVVLMWWAMLELFQGVNGFRRTLGLIVIIFIVYSFVKIFL